jgi:hypothetical protein
LPAACDEEAIMDVIHDCVAGLDVHKDTVVACVRAMSGTKAARECRRFETTTDGLSALLEWLILSKVSVAAMEATGVYWLPVWKMLSAGEFELVLANAAHIKAVPGRKTDMNDAMWIADLAAHGLIKASFVPDAQLHDLPGEGRGEGRVNSPPAACLPPPHPNLLPAWGVARRPSLDGLCGEKGRPPVRSNCGMLQRARFAFGSDQSDRSPAPPGIEAHAPAADDGGAADAPILYQSALRLTHEGDSRIG